MLNQQPNRTSKLISDCFEDRGPLVFISNWTQGSALSCLIFWGDLRAQSCLAVAYFTA